MKRFMITWADTLYASGYADYKPDDYSEQEQDVFYSRIAQPFDQEDVPAMEMLKAFIQDAEVGDSTFTNNFAIARLKDVEVDGTNS